jgi:hypothetical protein
MNSLKQFQTENFKLLIKIPLKGTLLLKDKSAPFCSNPKSVSVWGSVPKWNPSVSGAVCHITVKLHREWLAGAMSNSPRQVWESELKIHNLLI